MKDTTIALFLMIAYTHALLKLSQKSFIFKCFLDALNTNNGILRLLVAYLIANFIILKGVFLDSDLFNEPPQLSMMLFVVLES